MSSFSATDSLICNADSTRQNVYLTPLNSGPANSDRALYTALIRAHNISTTWDSDDTTKTVISLNLDFYEKCCLLVRTKNALKDNLIFCFGELHALFAHVRAIDASINSSGLEKSWQVAGWFDSLAAVHK